MGAAIEIERLTKRYGKKPGIRHVDFTVKQGQVFRFLGSNGLARRRSARC